MEWLLLPYSLSFLRRNNNKWSRCVSFTISHQATLVPTQSSIKNAHPLTCIPSTDLEASIPLQLTTI